METELKQKLKTFLARIDTLKGWLFRQRRNPLEAELPWITMPAIQWLQTYLKKDMSAFEWGTGGSTAYLARRVKKIISVEHHPIWFARVRLALWLRRIRNVTLLSVPPEPARRDSSGDPYQSTSEKHRQYRFERYVKIIDAYPDASFDLIMIDGRARAACLDHARNKVRIGGYILLDDSDRPAYASVIATLHTFARTDFSGQVPYYPPMEKQVTSVFERIS